MALSLSHSQQRQAAAHSIRRPVATLAPYTEHLLRRLSRGALIWGAAIIAYTASLIAAFPSFRGQLDVSTYPESLREAFNIESFDTVQPFLSVEVYSLMPLVLVFFPMTIFAAAIAGAEERGSLDVLLGNPLPRRNLVLANAIAVALWLAIMMVVLGGVSWIVGTLVDADLPVGDAFAPAINLWPISMAFGGLALFGSALFRQRAVALGLPVLVLFAMYFIDLAGKLIDGAEDIRYASAFKYYGDAAQDGIWWLGAAILTAVALIFIAAAVIAFDRRDIYS